MEEWKNTSTGLQYEVRESRLLNVLLSLAAFAFGVTIVFTSGWLGWDLLTSFSTAHYVRGLLLGALLLGLFLTLSIVSLGATDPNVSLAFDTQQKHMTYSKGNHPIVLPFAWFDHICITKRIVDENDVYTTIYPIYLMMKDGSFFWLYTLREQELAKDFAAKVAEQVQVAVVDQAEGEGKQLATPMPLLSLATPPTAPCLRVQKHKDKSVQVTQRPTRKSLADEARYMLTLAALLCVPGLLLWESMQRIQINASSTKILVVTLCALSLLGCALWFVLRRRTTRALLLHPDELIVQTGYRPAWLNPLFARQIQIPKDAITAIRVNRTEETFWLSLELAEGFPVGTGTKWLLKASSARPKSLVSKQAGGLEVGVWQVDEMTNVGYALSHLDLYAVQAQLHNQRPQD